MIKQTFFLLAVLGYFCLADSGYTQAQTHDAWTIRCADTEGGRECEMFQRLTLAETGERIIEMAFGFPPHRPQGRGVIVLPLGVLLPEGAQLFIDEHDPYRFDIRYCTADGCYAFIGINDSFIQRLKQGNEAIISFQTLDGQAVNVTLSLLGFTKAFTQISPN